METKRLSELTRLDLFEQVWSRPMEEVARILGVSPRAVAKRCEQLHLPQPPDDYWDRLAEGKTDPKPPIPAFIRERQRRSSGDRRHTRVTLAPRQSELFTRACEALDLRPGESDLDLDGATIGSIDPEAAASLMVWINRWGRDWAQDVATRPGHQSSLERVVSKLVQRIAPLASETIVIFEEGRAPVSWGPSVLVHLSPTLRSTISTMASIARNHQLDRVARRMDAANHAWRFRELFPEELYSAVDVDVCVSKSEVWVEARSRIKEWEFRSKRFQLDLLVPEHRLGEIEKELPVVGGRGWQPDHRRWIREHSAESEMFDSVWEVFRDAETGLERPSPSWSPMLSMWLSEAQGRAMKEVKGTLTDIAETLENWEVQLELDAERIARAITDVHPGDIVVGTGRRGPTRLIVERVYGLFSTSNPFIMIEGRRFRKDGYPGKARDVLYVHLEPDSGREHT